MRSVNELLTVCVLLLIATPLGGWVNIGPNGGEARSIAVAGDDVYLLNSRSGVFRSEHSKSWELVFADNTARRVIAADQIYVASARGLFATNDGIQWRSLRVGPVLDVTAAAGRIYISTTSGFLKSIDGGATWQSIPAPLSEVAAPIVLLRVDPAGTHLYAVVGGALFVTVNDGETWQALEPRNVAALAFDDALYTGGSEGVSRCTARCERISSSEVVDLAVRRDSVYAATGSGVLRINSSALTFDDAPVLSLAVHGDELIAGTTAGVFRSGDGVSWRPANEGLPNVRIASLAVSDTVVAATEGQGLMRRAGSTWIQSESGLPRHPLARFVRCDGAACFTAVDRVVYGSSDGGASWTRRTAIDAADVAIVSGVPFAATATGVVRLDPDPITVTRTRAETIAAHDGIVFAAGGLDAAISTDSGGHWVSRALPFVAFRTGVIGGHLVAATGNGISMSSDLGVTWSDATLPLRGGTWTAIGAGSSALFVALADLPTGTDALSGVYATADGVRWSHVAGSEALPADVTSLAGDANAIFAGTHGESVFTSSTPPSKQRAVRR